jgi:hypothetical protein
MATMSASNKLTEMNAPAGPGTDSPGTTVASLLAGHNR